MMCWNYDKTPWEEFPDMSISLLSSVSNSKEFRIKVPPQVSNMIEGLKKHFSQRRQSHFNCSELLPNHEVVFFCCTVYLA